MIADAEDGSLEEKDVNRIGRMWDAYETKDPEEHAEPVSDENDPEPRAKCRSEHSQGENTWRDEKEVPVLDGRSSVNA